MALTQLKIQSESPQQTQELAAALARRLHGGDVLALEGELGAGKTVFVRGLAEGLGISPTVVSSPTFIIRQEYDSELPDVPTLVHIDAYRVKGPEDLETIGWSELLNDLGAITAVEWPSRIESSLPTNRIDIALLHTGEQSRAISLHVPPHMVDRLADLKFGKPPTSRCRRCGRAVEASGPSFPFCSERCRLADLGAWFSEDYRLSRRIEADEELDV